MNADEIDLARRLAEVVGAEVDAEEVLEAVRALVDRRRRRERDLFAAVLEVAEAEARHPSAYRCQDPECRACRGLRPGRTL